MPATGAPRWYTSLTQLIADNSSSSLYQLATTDAAHKPHVRTLVHRAFLTPQDHPSLPLLLTTTDRRSAKAGHLLHNPSVELNWWIGGSADQFRIGGTAHLIPLSPSPSGTAGPGSGVETAARCPGIAALDAAGFDWRGKADELFAMLSAGIRASFAGDVAPGTRLAGGYAQMDAWPLQLPASVAEAKDEGEESAVRAAREHCALLVIEPTEVDWVQLGVEPNRRTRFWREGEVWKEEAVAP
ncbi:hypothetical protein DENSPDRAFT_844457 [Dentipellis sp. KUC8613]|nr:hypothetical protein DENSPDRAFT_844457 [Dentipellis sp. KUC8613]